MSEVAQFRPNVAETVGVSLRRAAFSALGIFVLLAPALPQVFGISSPAFRAWDMFAAAGVGLLKGEFVVRSADGVTRSVTPLNVLGIARYPIITAPDQPHRVTNSDDLARISGNFCKRLKDTELLSFDGWVATVRGWEPLRGEDLCHVAPR